MLERMRKRLAELLEQRKALAADRDQITGPAQTENRDLSEDENTRYQAKRGEIKGVDDQITELRGRITEAEEDEKREQAAADAYAQTGQTGQKRERATGGARIGYEPMTYGRQAKRHSYFVDLARDSLGRGDGDGGVSAARERLARHARELTVELPAREARRDQRAQEELRSVDDLPDHLHESVFERGMEQRVNPNRTDGQGGYFVQVAALAA